PSGDQNGKYAASVPGNSTASSLSSERTQRDILPSRLATKAICVPSGESAGYPFRYKGAKCVPSGGNKVDQVTRGTAWERHQPPIRARTSITRAPAIKPRNNFRFGRRGRKPSVLSARDPNSATHLNSLARSLVLCQRSSGSFARHFLTMRPSAGGLSGCNCK